MNIRSLFIGILGGVSLLLILLSVLSLIHDIPLWYTKALDFPRLQYLLISLFCLIIFLIAKRRWNFFSVLVVSGLLFSMAVHSLKIGPYFLGEKIVPDVKMQGDRETSVKILIANVLMTNREFDRFLEVVYDHNPDVVLAMEVDKQWVEHLQVLERDFRHVIKHPLDNAYGMALYSKLPLKFSEKKFLKHSDVPSFHTIITLPSGQDFAFHGVHPVAPFPSQKFPDNVGKEEVALSKVGSLVRKSDLPSIVAGDFNDVSWSRTTLFFENEGNLRNVRLGRGLYNTFNANSWIMRWPLDHFFVTEEFKLRELKKLEKFGSDHFPMMAEFVLPKN